MNANLKLMSILACGTAILFGCFNLRQTYPERDFFRLEAAYQGEPLQTIQGTNLYVRNFRVDDAFSHSSFVYRTAENTWTTDYYNKFFVSPRVQMTEEIREWLRSSGLFENVLGASTAPDVTHVLEGRIVKFYGDYREPGDPQAVVSVAFTLTNVAGTSDRIVLRETYEATAPFESENAASLVDAWETALQEVLRSFSQDVQSLPREQLTGTDG